MAVMLWVALLLRRLMIHQFGGALSHGVISPRPIGEKLLNLWTKLILGYTPMRAARETRDHWLSSWSAGSNLSRASLPYSPLVICGDDGAVRACLRVPKCAHGCHWCASYTRLSED